MCLRVTILFKQLMASKTAEAKSKPIRHVYWGRQSTVLTDLRPRGPTAVRDGPEELGLWS